MDIYRNNYCHFIIDILNDEIFPEKGAIRYETILYVKSRSKFTEKDRDVCAFN